MRQSSAFAARAGDIGVDGRVGEDLRAGVMVSYSDSTRDYSAVNDGQPQKGEYELGLHIMPCV